MDERAEAVGAPLFSYVIGYNVWGEDVQEGTARRAALDACLKDGAKAEAMVKHFETNFEADGVEGTPTFIINGDKHSNMSYDDMKAILDEKLAE
jgi:protein-disulfide isomerase